VSGSACARTALGSNERHRLGGPESAVLAEVYFEAAGPGIWRARANAISGTVWCYRQWDGVNLNLESVLASRGLARSVSAADSKMGLQTQAIPLQRRIPVTGNQAVVVRDHLAKGEMGKRRGFATGFSRRRLAGRTWKHGV
jgi:hypothetical protein